ncbi:predicted protein [Histoplasma capsulatum var. duboisii H88]|uniref:Predicted protein n=2 Tax=Ajellomyces capsulatus TaxID=5037 RepID=F0UBL3_AJEC8|nr:predicted protein [Histoplasma capsulatum H143]EGC43069.1 predicted protein [Histoplasma capsulatum var. duboisii H88]
MALMSDPVDPIYPCCVHRSWTTKFAGLGWGFTTKRIKIRVVSEGGFLCPYSYTTSHISSIRYRYICVSRVQNCKSEAGNQLRHGNGAVGNIIGLTIIVNYALLDLVSRGPNSASATASTTHVTTLLGAASFRAEIHASRYPQQLSIFRQTLISFPAEVFKWGGSLVYGLRYIGSPLVAWPTSLDIPFSSKKINMPSGLAQLNDPGNVAFGVFGGAGERGRGDHIFPCNYLIAIDVANDLFLRIPSVGTWKYVVHLTLNRWKAAESRKTKLATFESFWHPTT